MGFDRSALAQLIACHGPVARIVVARTKGSVPREPGAAMLVWQGGQSGTIGGGALVALGLVGRPTGPGEIILAVAVLSILLTAPVGAWAISWSGERWLSKDESGIKNPVPADNY